MANIHATIRLSGVMPGQSDPVAINVDSWGLDATNPSVTSATKTTSSTKFVILENAQGAGVDHYVYIRNIGTNGDLATGGNVVVMDEHAATPRTIANLDVGDFIFIPILGDATNGGIQVDWDGATATNYVYAFFKRV
tara:strand:- start:204 stop:614 length:411 start_codon:yes stop_codon:yes gene_type:complete